MKFQKRPVTVDAIQFLADLTVEQLNEFAGVHQQKVGEVNPFRFAGGGIYVGTPAGELRANPGDWIVKDERGELWPMKAQTFEREYASEDQPTVQQRYDELIMAVARKWEGETRHQTALRYIKQAEESAPDSPASADAGKPVA